MTRAPVFRVRRCCRGRGARLVDPRQLRGAALKGRGGTTNHGELLDVTPYVVGNSVYLRFRYDTKDAMGMNMATIATEAVCGVVETETAASLVALSGNLCSDKKPAAINAVGARPERHRRRSDPARGSSKNACTPRPKRSRNSTHARTWSAPKAASLGFNAHVANVVAAMFLATGQDEARRSSRARTPSRPPRVQDGDLYVSVSIASLEVGTVGGGTKLPTQSGASISSASAAAATRRLQRRRPRQMHRRRFPRGRTLPSLRARLAAPLQRPRRTRSVGNCMGVVVRPRFIGSEFVDPTLIMNVLSREIPRDYEIPEIQRISRTYYQRLVQSRTCLREGLLCNLRPNRQRLNRLVSFFG